MTWQRWRAGCRGVLAIFFVAAGSLHFLRPAFYVKIIPPYLPYPWELVYLSGACEILGGMGVLIPALRRPAGYGLIALLIAVFPANIQMVIDNLRSQPFTILSVLLLIRLPIQLLLIAWVGWCTRPGEPADAPQKREE